MKCCENDTCKIEQAELQTSHEDSSPHNASPPPAPSTPLNLPLFTSPLSAGR